MAVLQASACKRSEKHAARGGVGQKGTLGYMGRIPTDDLPCMQQCPLHRRLTTAAAAQGRRKGAASLWDLLYPMGKVVKRF